MNETRALGREGGLYVYRRWSLRELEVLDSLEIFQGKRMLLEMSLEKVKSVTKLYLALGV